jgi:hypothetical protein
MHIYIYIHTYIYIYIHTCKYFFVCMYTYIYIYIYINIYIYIYLYTYIDTGENVDKFEKYWTGAIEVRGEILLKLLFHIAITCCTSLTSDTWLSLIKLLLYLRNRGILPPRLFYY